jgi:hypothetical protein
MIKYNFMILLLQLLQYYNCKRRRIQLIPFNSISLLFFFIITNKILIQLLFFLIEFKSNQIK